SDFLGRRNSPSERSAGATDSWRRSRAGLHRLDLLRSGLDRASFAHASRRLSPHRRASEATLEVRAIFDKFRGKSGEFAWRDRRVHSPEKAKAPIRFRTRGPYLRLEELLLLFLSGLF